MSVHNPPFVPTVTAVDEIREAGIGSIDGLNLVFNSSSNFEVSTLKVYLNGQLLDTPDDYTITDTNEITMVDAPLSTKGLADKVTLIYIPA